MSHKKSISLPQSDNNTYTKLFLRHEGGVGDESLGHNLTGSLHVLEILDSTENEVKKILIDMGGYQGKGDIERNISHILSGTIAQIVTHAHFDHAGGLLAHTKEEQSIEHILATESTIHAVKILLEDCVKISQRMYEAEKRKRLTLLKNILQPAIKTLKISSMPRNTQGDRLRTTEEEIQNSQTRKNAQQILSKYNIDTTNLGWKEKFLSIEKPEYTLQDIENLVQRIQSHEKNDGSYNIDPNISVSFHNAGHIIGSVSPLIQVKMNDGTCKNILFTGDLGSYKWEIHPSGLPNPPHIPIDALVIESTYGGITRKSMKESIEEYQNVLIQDLANHDIIVHSCFAMDRLQNFLHQVIQMKKDGTIDQNTSIYLESPLGVKYIQPHINEAKKIHNTEEAYNFSTQVEQLIYANALEKQEKLKQYIENIDPKNGNFTIINAKNRDEYLSLPDKKIIITTGGMMEGGPILSYLKKYLSNSKAAFYITGYMADDTTGKRLMEMAQKNGNGNIVLDEEIIDNIHATIRNISGFSGHADNEDILAYISLLNLSPTCKIVIVHGDKNTTSLDLKQSIMSTFNIASERIHIGELGKLSYQHCCDTTNGEDTTTK